MKKNYFLLLIFFCLRAIVFGQQSKYDSKNSNFVFPAYINNKFWEKVPYEKLKTGYKKKNIDFDAFLNEKAFLALYMFNKRGDNNQKYESPIIVIIDTITDLKNTIPIANDTIVSANTFLEGMEGRQMDKNNFGKIYFDKTTHSYLSKNTTIMYEKSGLNFGSLKKESFYLIKQIKYTEKYKYTFEYRCSISESKSYFNLFEQIIRTVK